MKTEAQRNEAQHAELEAEDVLGSKLIPGAPDPVFLPTSQDGGSS